MQFQYSHPCDKETYSTYCFIVLRRTAINISVERSRTWSLEKNIAITRNYFLAERKIAIDSYFSNLSD